MGKYSRHKYGRLLPRRYRWSRIVCFKYHNPQCGNCTFCRSVAKKYGRNPEKMGFPINLIRVCYRKDSYEEWVKRVFN
jgi:hypothetical protein